VVLAEERTAVPAAEPSMDEEERHTLPGTFIVHVKTIDTFCRHTPLALSLGHRVSHEMIIA
jgi:hypothetical protein